MSDEINELVNILKASKKIVVITGAGISTPSGIPDIRSEHGAMNNKDLIKKYKYNYETIVSNSFFYRNTEEFYRYYKEQMIFKDAKPNYAHLFLKELENYKDVTIITQNIDGLHALAGSTKIIEFHGSVLKNRCVSCNAFYPLEEILKQKGVPYCPKCGGIIKPEVVLFEEPIINNAINDSLKIVGNADTMLIIGSSMVVYPAAALPFYFRGKNMVIINRDPTPLDNRATLVLHDDIIKILKKINLQDLNK